MVVMYITVKQDKLITEYSFSQSTLEQVDVLYTCEN